MGSPVVRKAATRLPRCVRWVRVSWSGHVLLAGSSAVTQGYRETGTGCTDRDRAQGLRWDLRLPACRRPAGAPGSEYLTRRRARPHAPAWSGRSLSAPKDPHHHPGGRPGVLARPGGGVTAAAKAPGRKWVGDITCIRTRAGVRLPDHRRGLRHEEGHWLCDGGSHEKLLGVRRHRNGGTQLPYHPR